MTTATRAPAANASATPARPVVSATTVPFGERIPGYLTILEASSQLGIHKSGINRLVHSGILPAKLVYRTWWIREAGLEVAFANRPRRGAYDRAESRVAKRKAKAAEGKVAKRNKSS